MTFTNDSRWLAVSTKRGTTHLFALNPYGGGVNVRTHTKTHVVNKTTRHQRSIGIDEQTISNENGFRDSSSAMLANASSNQFNGHSNNHHSNAARQKRAYSECIFSPAITLIRQPTDNLVGGLSAPFNVDCLCLASSFGISRGFLNPEDMTIHQDYTPRACSSLFVISWHGRLIEYVLEPIPGKNLHSREMLDYSSGS